MKSLHGEGSTLKESVMQNADKIANELDGLIRFFMGMEALEEDEWKAASTDKYCKWLPHDVAHEIIDHLWKASDLLPPPGSPEAGYSYPDEDPKRYEEEEIPF